MPREVGPKRGGYTGPARAAPSASPAKAKAILAIEEVEEAPTPLRAAAGPGRAPCARATGGAQLVAREATPEASGRGSLAEEEVADGVDAPVADAPA